MKTIQITLFALSFCLTGLGLQAQNMTSGMKDTEHNMAVAPALPQDISPLLTGEKVPVIQLPDAGGKMQDVNALISSGPIVLVFYRGGWCPYCTRQLSGLQEAMEPLEKMGYRLLAISTDSPGKLSETLGKQSLEYTLLSDADLKVARAFGIAFQAPEGYHGFLPESSGGKNTGLLLPVPSVFILDREGVIRFEHINPDFRQRISPGLLIAVAGAIAKEDAM
ncbi:peroxiredoxin-like family protein [Sinomicrobium soli]|uniref:peroxiredoxin-like family protein n=1 Tax=Sinomicrobium sp. N-1-3-6 TaxID=2219864 RepID=UPI000DCDB778|nr:peroxiredoxin-like family protein [Sinomicrobium sp. N-1-3-6]RAV31025.1 AhpC/TSA family protein [Sinomicrobium sp. N-1-3-6]